MRRFLRWLLGLEVLYSESSYPLLSQRLDELEDDVEHLGRRFTKLQGQVTRSWREELPPEDDDEDDDEILKAIARRNRGTG